MQLSDKLHIKRLNEFGLSLITTYKSGDKIIDIDSNSTSNQDVIDAIRLGKRYLRPKKVLLEIKNFDPRIKYTFAKSTKEKNCSNCGAPIDSQNGECPYCGTVFNMDYLSKDLGTKYHTDLVMNSNLYKKITLLIDVIVSFIISYIYIKTTGRTFNIFDFSKVLVGTALLSLIFYYIFYYLDTFFILLPIKIYKTKINNQQTKFWLDNSKELDKTKFFTNLNYELQKYYFENPINRNIIDYDLIDYTSISKNVVNDNKFINIDILVREVYYNGTKLKQRQVSKNLKLQYFKREFSLEIGANVLRCKNCGNSIDAFKTECPHCGTRQNYLQEWYLVN